MAKCKYCGKPVESGVVLHTECYEGLIGKQPLKILPPVDGLPTLYLCDPEKNVACRKKGCYTNGGKCRYTTHEEYAVGGDENA